MEPLASPEDSSGAVRSDLNRVQQTNTSSNETALPEDVLKLLGTRYTNLRYISSGATSSVFFAIDTILDKPVAIKVLTAASAKELIGFQKEAKAAGKLDHPHLVHVLTFGVTPSNRAYMILDFVDGQSLDAILQKKKTLPVETALVLLLQICRGMIYAHRKQISHRDLKTSNIIVKNFDSSDPQAIVIDFGLAREIQQQEQTQLGSSSGRVQGTPMFISPEQATGKYGDARSDIYSLGCIIYKMLTGSAPFKGEDLFSLLKKHVEDPPPTLSELAPKLEFPPELEECALHMLEKDPERRFQSMEEVRDCLASIQRALMPASPAIREHVEDEVQKKKLDRVAILVACLVALLIPIAWIGLNLIKPAEPQKAIKHFTQAKVVTAAQIEENKFNKFFRTTGPEVFLEEHDMSHIAPRSPNLLKNEDLECLSKIQLPLDKINLGDTHINGKGFKYLEGDRIIGVDLCKNVNLDDGVFESLLKMPNLERLSLSCTNVNDRQLSMLHKLPKLKEIRLKECPNLTDACMDTFPNWKGLEELDTQNNNLKASAFMNLGKCKKLTRLTLSGNQISDEAVISILENNPNVRDLKLAACDNITSKTLFALIAKRPDIGNLCLSKTRLNPKDVAQVKKLRDLTYLDLTGIPVGAKELEAIGTLTRLLTLYLDGITCGDEGLKGLYSLKRLDTITLINAPKLTSQGISEMKKHMNYRTVVISHREGEKHGEAIDETLDMILKQDVE